MPSALLTRFISGVGVFYILMHLDNNSFDCRGVQ